MSGQKNQNTSEKKGRKSRNKKTKNVQAALVTPPVVDTLVFGTLPPVDLAEPVVSNVRPQNPAPAGQISPSGLGETKLNVKQEPKSKGEKSSFRSRAKGYAAPVLAVNQKVIKSLESLGVPTHVVTTMSNTSEHPVSAAVRVYATVQALIILEAEMHDRPRKVISAYGSPRDLEHVRKINAGLPENELVDLIVHRPLVTAADLGRDNMENPLRDLPQSDFLLMVDVYMTESTPFSPSFLEKHLSVGGTAVWVGQCFKGAAGVVFNEGGWWRDPDSHLVTHRPDISSPASPPHDPCDWIWEDSHRVFADGSMLAWYVKTTVTTVKIVVFHRIQHIPLVKNVNDIIIPWQFTQREVIVMPRDSWWTSLKVRLLPIKWVLSSLPRRKAIIYKPVFESVRDSNVGRPKTFQLYRQISLQVSNAMKEGEGALLLSLFPERFKDLVIDTAQAVLVDLVEAEAMSLSDLVWSNGESVSTYNQALANLEMLPVQPQMGGKYALVSFLVLAAAWLVKRALTRKVDLSGITCASLVKHDLVAIAIAPILEETIKRALPWGLGRYFGVYEILIKLCDILRLPAVLPVKLTLAVIALPAVKMHGDAYSAKTWWEAVKIHTIFNLKCVLLSLALRTLIGKFGWSDAASGYNGPLALVLSLFAGLRMKSEKSRFRQFKDDYYTSEWSDRPALSHDISTSVFPSEEAETPTQQFPFFNPKPLCPILKAKGSIPLPGPLVGSNYYWLLPTSVPGYVPSRSDEHMLGVLTSRILVAPPLDPLVQARRWSAFSPLLPQFPPIVRDDWEEAWLAHFSQSRQKKRYISALKIRSEQGPMACAPHLDRIEVMVKVDETLTKTDLRGDQIFMQLKPRSIANIHPSVQAEIGPVIYAATQNLKKVWSITPDPILYCGVSVYFTYGGAATDSELTRWAEFALIPKKDSLHIMVSGDDSIVVSWDAFGKMSVYEGDFGMFDQSQSFGPLLFEYRMLRQLGVSDAVISMMERLSGATYSFRAKNSNKVGSSDVVKVSLTQRWIRHTGGSDTSLGNSGNTAHAMLFCLMNKNLDLKDSFSYLGFDIKIKQLASFDHATFLKGMWYRVDSAFGYYWGPLPSRILKVGKSLEDPRKIYREEDFQKAARMFLNDVASGYSSFIRVPLLCAFVKNFHYQKAILPERNPWKVQAAQCEKPQITGAVWEQLYARYGIGYDAWKDVEERYPKMPFTFSEHPVYVILNQVDYN